MKPKTILCSNCEEKITELISKLKSEGEKMKRCRIFLDCLADLEICLTDGDIDRIVRRDIAYKSGRKIGRRIKK